MSRLSLLFVFLFCLMTNNLLAQSQKPKTQLVSFEKNVDAPLSIKEKDMLFEVYKDQLDKYIISSPSRLRNMKHLLRNRIQIIEMNNVKAPDKFVNLKDVELFRTFNKNLKRDKEYVKDDFNPLKYNLPFFKIGGNTYKIFDSNFYLRIEPQTTKK